MTSRTSFTITVLEEIRADEYDEQHSQKILGVCMVHSMGSLHVFFAFLGISQTNQRHLGQLPGKMNSFMCPVLMPNYLGGFFGFKLKHSGIYSSPPVIQKEQTSAEN